MIVGVDIGGWGGVASDVTVILKNVRVSNTSHSEADILQLAENGVRLNPVLFGTGGTIASINVTEMVEKIVIWFKKYGKGGTVWVGKAYGDKGGQYFELLNEPENPNFWSDGKTTAGKEAYIHLMKEVRKALNENFSETVRPKMLISSDGGYAGPAYGQSLLALEPKLPEIIDGVTCHPYGGSGNGKVKSGEGNRTRVTQAHADFGVPVFVTEVGWNTSAKGSPGVSEPFTEAEQKANIESFYKFCWEKGYVEMVIYFNFIDYSPEEYWGLENASTTPRTKKPSYTTMKEMREKYEEGAPFSAEPANVLIPTSNYPPTAPFLNQTSTGRIEFFKRVATKSGTLKELFLHTNAVENTGVTSVVLGLFSDEAGKPGTHLGSATYNPGGTVPINTLISVSGLSIAVTVGTTYWFAILPLGPEGGKQLHYSTANEGGAEWETANVKFYKTMTEFPLEFTGQVEEHEGPPPMYGTGEVATPPPPTKVPIVKQRLSKQAMFRSMYR